MDDCTTTPDDLMVAERLKGRERTVDRNVFNLALCQALGLDPGKVRALKITATANGVPTVEVERTFSAGEASSLVELLKRYRLEPLEAAP